MVVCAPSESIQMAKRRGQTAQQRLFVSFPVGPTVTRCSGVAARGVAKTVSATTDSPPVSGSKTGLGFE